MRILVIPHNHWIGYHVAARLLDDGCQVDGIRNTQIDSDFEDFFGRNSHFQAVDEVKNNYDIAIIINDSDRKHLHQHAAKVLHIQTDPRLNMLSDSTVTSVISVPYLIGEGMEMDGNGLFVDGRLLSYADKDWQKKAIYIKDFLNVLMQWIKMKHLPKLIEIISVNNNLTNTKVEKKQVLLENRDINEVIKTIQIFNKRLR
ncbi:NAD(P)-dependent oxidoreductase [Oceanobacillus sp. CFH 90083]|uniref:NAD(P)-dependent oxidoreductase n=1 Tax=Oceanobacillus sp. CFH 90083 TaxID=2592336 RepID=UPI00128C1CC6|nr:NAD(P)-dependent oxidoreductase [Oceanobacillus sp. CFH 90083]